MIKPELEQAEFALLSQIQSRKQGQVRQRFDPEALITLTESVRQHGIVQPLLVRPLLGEVAKYEIVAGERRLLAAHAAGLDKVPVVVRNLDNTEAITLALIENLHREDLNAIEETESILALLALKLELSQEETVSTLLRMAKEAKGQTAQNVLDQSKIATIISVFDSLGRMSWESFVASRIPLLSLPKDLQQAIQTRVLDYTKAVALFRLKDDEQRSILLKQVLEQNWSIRQIQAHIKQLRLAELPSRDAEICFKGKCEEDDMTSEVNRARINQMLRSALDSEISESKQTSATPEFAQTALLPRTVEPEVINFSSSSQTQSTPRQQEVYTLPNDQPSYKQLDLFAQMRIISRQWLELLRRRQIQTCNTAKQERLEALLDELDHLLSDEL
ncbi:MAG: ParB/RepB/Spo0J family partition protein [Chroococcidiopsidaceae cyanobacterium CP_BM_ER_R8_30]|nr:ParB/RepB/Spo0J family partition protein [Chroococcidiopsidaceae cyanobacterium CP_BM_ER_R8_30]